MVSSLSYSLSCFALWATLRSSKRQGGSTKPAENAKSRTASQSRFNWKKLCKSLSESGVMGNCAAIGIADFLVH